MKPMLCLLLSGLTTTLFAAPVRMIAPSDINQGVSFAITQTGLYIFSDDIVARSATATAIIISSSHVILDLNGKSLVGSPGADGIAIRDRVGNIKIRNGTISSFGNNGINIAGVSGVTTVRLENLLVTNNGTAGIAVAGCGMSRITACRAYANGTDGISLNSSRGIMISQCNVSRNANRGIVVGLTTSTTAYICDCDAVQNLTGIRLQNAFDTYVTNCRFSANTTGGFSIGSNSGRSILSNSTAFGNPGFGFQNGTTANGAVVGTVAFANTSTNYDGTVGALTAVSVNRATQLAPGSDLDTRYDNIAVV
jgi:parallel beta-helix repeat protein